MAEATKVKMVCGIVMPISTIDGCTESHWADVLEIISDAVEQAGFDANLVSHADEVGIIHKRIIQNLHDNPVVVVDVSGKNPNVMFELGMRLAFDKPTIIIKDSHTPFTFDTSSIEHLEYPRDLRFSKITEFKEKLSAKISATYTKSSNDPNYTTFLKHFGEFTIAKLDKKEVSGQEYILDELRSMRQSLNRMERISVKDDRNHRPSRERGDISLCFGKRSGDISEALDISKSIDGVIGAMIADVGNHKHLEIYVDENHKESLSDIKSHFSKFTSTRKRIT
ncbi:hypothetical protein [Pseudomonas sp. CCOS 191]|uniref:hypothetical protein n=1 Tax=Pseudomonas sp. CCOS 191 TaxID=1649877 RepID=UPI0006249B5B|nr:hypothetical protein [Pseudomonas sp. CCOS 191]CRI54832.1 hypothetical protein CCOS191_0296 [Pseudomonas sp. CCOS 191]